jgi:hypothetical protein
MRAALVAAVLLASAFGAAFAAPHGPAPAGKPACHPGQTFENDDVAVWFHGMKSFVQVTDKASNGTYGFKSSALEERDAGDAAVRTMNLERAYPKTSTCSISEDDNFVNMSIAVTDTVRAATGGDVGNATVTLAYHFNKTGLGVKFDLLVDGWPWADGAGDGLAYTFGIEAENLTLEAADNGVGVRDSDGQSVGYVDWAANATARYADGTEQEANVTSTETGDNATMAVTLAFTNVTGGYSGLEMDPWMGVGDYLIVAGHLVPLQPVEALLPAPAQRAVRGLL